MGVDETWRHCVTRGIDNFPCFAIDLAHRGDQTVLDRQVPQYRFSTGAIYQGSTLNNDVVHCCFLPLAVFSFVLSM